MAGLRALAQIVSALRGLVPTPVLVAIVTAMVLYGVPVWIENARVKEVRGLVRQISRNGGDGPAADPLVDRVMTLATPKAERLVELGREAHRRQLTRLRDRAWVELERLDPATARRERALVEPPKIRDRFPLEAQVAVAGMIESGAVEAARSRLAAALERFPDDPELLALRDRLEAPPDADPPRT